MAFQAVSFYLCEHKTNVLWALVFPLSIDRLREGGAGRR